MSRLPCCRLGCRASVAPWRTRWSARYRIGCGRRARPDWGQLAGRRVPFEVFTAEMAAEGDTAAANDLAARPDSSDELLAWVRGEPDDLERRILTWRELLSESPFHTAAPTDGGGTMTLWGGGAGGAGQRPWAAGARGPGLPRLGRGRLAQLRPQPASDLGLSLSLASAWGGSAISAAAALWARPTMADLPTGQPRTESAGRLTAEAAYGLPLFGAAATGTVPRPGLGRGRPRVPPRLSLPHRRRRRPRPQREHRSHPSGGGRRRRAAAHYHPARHPSLVDRGSHSPTNAIARSLPTVHRHAASAASASS